MECTHGACQRRGQALSTSPKTNRRSSRPSNRSSPSQCATSRRTLRTYGGRNRGGASGSPHRLLHRCDGSSSYPHPGGEHVGRAGRAARCQAGPRWTLTGLAYTCDGPGVYLGGSRRRGHEVRYERHRGPRPTARLKRAGVPHRARLRRRARQAGLNAVEKIQRDTRPRRCTDPPKTRPGRPDQRIHARRLTPTNRRSLAESYFRAGRGRWRGRVGRRRPAAAGPAGCRRALDQCAYVY